MLIPIGDNIDRKSFPILPGVLLFANLAVFIYQMRIFFENPTTLRPTMDFVETWGLVPTDLAGGHFNGLFTHMFLHGGFSHIIGNMLVLWAFSCSLENGLGTATLALFYIMWGLAAGLLHAAMEWGSDMPLIGASGAIAGLMGAYTVLYGADAKIKTVFFFFFKFWVVPVPAFLYGGAWFYLQLYNSLQDDGGGIAWYAHIGGFAAGAITALLVRNQLDIKLVKDRDGTLCFKDTTEDDKPRVLVQGDRYEIAEHDVAGDGSTLPEDCPYCTTSLGEHERITPGVARCSNPECGRFVYAGAVLV
ncbi:rhomboid family intramembrane serine protease [Adhaeretor mobilis]|uniref:Rhomboid family protein n=1 Tax=Adhaeretor mobilis TaxID=1930276 RepID=A0A517MSV4_9BACT|nr:rhomboid family intramembrane serine protease [Adhaeretor mobilis]QDS97877.1 Rhomboid family protein [Adhaeretor mobilis]